MTQHQIEANLTGGAGCSSFAGRHMGLSASLVASASRVKEAALPPMKIVVQGEAIDLTPQGKVIDLAPGRVIDLGQVTLVPWGR